MDYYFHVHMAQLTQIKTYLEKGDPDLLGPVERYFLEVGLCRGLLVTSNRSTQYHS